MSNIHRSYYQVYDGSVFIGSVDRTFADDIAVILPCGYSQRFWIDCSDKEAIARCNEMKLAGLPSC